MAKNDVLRLRIQDDLKQDAEDLAASLDISTSQLARMALREMIARHKAARLQEKGIGYTAPPPPPESPPVKLRNAIAPLRVPTAFYVVTRSSKARRV